MARYALRNQQRIIDAKGSALFGRIINSLDMHFIDNEIITICPSSTHDTYQQILINDIEHDFNTISFYVIAINYDVYNLAFNEYIG